VGCKNLFGSLLVNLFARAKTVPQVIGTRKTFKIVILPCEEVVLDNPVSIGRVGKLEAQDLGVLLRLL